MALGTQLWCQAIWQECDVSQTKWSARQEKQLKQWGSRKTAHEQWEVDVKANFNLWRGERNSDHCNGAVRAQFQFVIAKINMRIRYYRLIVCSWVDIALVIGHCLADPLPIYFVCYSWNSFLVVFSKGPPVDSNQLHLPKRPAQH